MTTDRRAAPRFPVQIEGKLMSPDMEFSVDVMINDLSEDGALLCTASPTDFVPERAYLWQATTRTLFECTVKWRKNQRMLGVQFASASSRDRRRQLLELVVPGSVRRRSRHRREGVIHCADYAA
jgi:hypothetical protein